MTCTITFLIVVLQSEIIWYQKCYLNWSMMQAIRRIYFLLQNVTTHMLHHVSRSIPSLGHFQKRWLFGIERHNGKVTRLAKNKGRKEATVSISYRVGLNESDIPKGTYSSPLLMFFLLIRFKIEISSILDRKEYR